ncbi:MAG: Carbohydrate ABC transporter substrate-binding protein, CUT1 family [Microgenomates group bacterium GW2011_GWF2_47_9]|nr:MAG: Carbohydrate ABC transporter substrate-binding protein, CUT1 family [Microgenomates group bacterium GW2011_GWF2_47_9]
MAKFPDPTKQYTATPLSSAISTSRQEPNPPAETIEQPPVSAEPPVAAPPPPPATPTPLPISPSPFRNLLPIILGVGVFIVLGFLAFTLLPRLRSKPDSLITLTYWGLWEPASVMQTVIADYERDHPNVKINYSQQSPKNYRSRLVSSIESGTGPDIARIHNTWLPMLKKHLSPKPASVALDLSDYYPVVQADFVEGGNLYAAPLEIDGLALYYNKDILNEAGATPPSDWDTLRKLAFDLTKRNPETKIIERAGVALGTANNVDFWSDILGLLILQNSGDPGNPSETAVRDALTYYTIFSLSDKSWDSTQPSSVYAFATGTTAMIIAPSWVIPEITAINPSLNYGVAPAPVLPNVNKAWATYWAEAVPSGSKNPTAAWEFLQYLSRPEVLQKLYTTAAQIRPIGEPYPLRSLASSLESDPLVAPFVSQGSSYVSWYLSSRTYDEGVNDEIIKYYEDTINAMNDGSGLGSVERTLEEGVKQVMAKYSLAN